MPRSQQLPNLIPLTIVNPPPPFKSSTVLAVALAHVVNPRALATNLGQLRGMHGTQAQLQQRLRPANHTYELGTW